MIALPLAPALGLSLAVPPLSGAAQAPEPGVPPAEVSSARLTAEIGPTGTDAEVRLEYTVSRAGATHAEDGADGEVGPLRLQVLGFGPAAVDSVRVDHGGSAAEVLHLSRETGSMRAGEHSLPASASGGEATVVSLVYRVAGAVERSGDEVRVRLPVAVLDLPPRQGGGPVFHAAVRLPDGWSVSGGFPTGLDAAPGGAWEVELPVVPALVSLRGRSDGAWRPGLPEALDALALVLLLGFGLVGWRHLSEMAGSAAPARAASGAPEARP